MTKIESSLTLVHTFLFPFPDLLLFYLNTHFALKIYRNPHWISENSLLENAHLFCYYAFNGLLFYFYMYSFAHIFAISFTIPCCLLLIFFVKIRQSYRQLVVLSRVRYSSAKYYRARKEYISTLRYFFAINHDYGRIFFATVIIFAPVNAMMTMWVTLGFVDLEKNGFVAFYVVYQLYFMLVLHLFLTYCTRGIHRLAKVLIKIMVGSGHQVGELRSRMVLAQDILALHTTKW